jgi:DNA-binding response OmpR family regulator
MTVSGSGATPTRPRRSPQSVLVVDDEPGILEIASAYLRRDGFEVRNATSGQRALDVVALQPPDLIVLDLMLPDISGEEVCARLRRTSSVPIIMLTAKSGESDRLRGLGLGADDYLVKPFSPRELVARVRAILRRSQPTVDTPADLLVLDGGRLEIDLASFQVRIDALPVPLTTAEFRLLASLARRPGRVFSRIELLEAIRRGDGDGFERTVDVHVKNARRKLEETSPTGAGYIATVHGVGYRLNEGRADT